MNQWDDDIAAPKQSFLLLSTFSPVFIRAFEKYKHS
jgi:hypothetical protein